MTENSILKARLQPGWRLSHCERATLAEIGRRSGRKGLQLVAGIAKPDTILAWYRRLVAAKFDGVSIILLGSRVTRNPEVIPLVCRPVDDRCYRKLTARQLSCRRPVTKLSGTLLSILAEDTAELARGSGDSRDRDSRQNDG